LSWLLLLPLCLVTLYLAVANRHSVLFSLDAFEPENPAIALEMPLFLVVLAAIFLGMLIGGAAVLTGRWRKDRARKAKSSAKTPAAGGSTAIVPSKMG
jgi:uncharacterized integral membrane protein